MARTPRADETVTEDTVDPVVTDDVNSAYDVGSRWINTATGKIFYCVDTTVGAAVWVDVSASAAGGSDVGLKIVLATPTTVTNFATITLALASASSGDCVYVGPGTYAESFTIPAGVAVRALADHEVTHITGALATGTRVTLNAGSYIFGFDVTCPTDALPAILHASAGHADILGCSITGAGASGGGILHSGAGISHIENLSYKGGTAAYMLSVTAGALVLRTGTVWGGTLTDVALATGGNMRLSNLGIVPAATITDVLEVGNATVVWQNGRIETGTNTVHITHDAAIVQLVGITVSTIGPTNHINVDGGLTTPEIDIDGGEWSFNKFVGPGAWIASARGLKGSFDDDTAGDEALIVINELHVGHAEGGHEAVFGEGDSYTRGMIVLTTDGTAGAGDGGNLTDVSDDAASMSGSTFSFQGVTAGHAIMFGSSLSDASDVIKHWGLKFQNSGTAAVEVSEHSFAFEIWDGSAWVEVGAMSTHGSLFHRYGSNHFLRASTPEHVRYGIKTDTTWATKLISGSTLYWSRVRIATTITTAPVFEQVKLHSSRSEINADGTHTFHGNSRFTQTLFSGGNVFGESGGVTTATVTIGSGGLPTGWPHPIKNSLLNGNPDAIYIQMNLPRGIDTSFAIGIKLTFGILGGAGANDAFLVCSFLPIEVAGIFEADLTGGVTPVARTIADTKTQITDAAQVDNTSGVGVDTTSEVKFQSIDFGPFEVRDYFEGDLVFIRVVLASDGTDNVDIEVCSIELSGVKWTLGEKL